MSLNTIKPELLKITAQELTALMPYLIFLAGTVLTLIVSVLKSIKPKWPVLIFSVATAITTLFWSWDWWMAGSSKVVLFNQMFVVDGFGAFFNVIILGALAVTLVTSLRYLDHEKLQYPEYNLLLLFSAFGMMILVGARDLIVLFIGLEIMSLAVYTLVGFRRSDRRSNEGAMKYFILGSAASALMLYGAALLYGSTGTTNIGGITDFVMKNQAQNSPLFTLGFWLVVVGFLFKVAAVPFHMWMPDVYEGAPTPVTGFMTTGLKAAAFASFLRIFLSIGFDKQLDAATRDHLHTLLWGTAAITMVVGNVIALTQTNVKRMLAYSSISHTGYLIIGFLVGKSEFGHSAMLVYLFSYVIMNLGAFVVLTLISARADTGLTLHDLSGLSKRSPGLAFALAVFLFSMAGVPPTAGFFAKYLLFYSAVQAGEIPLVIVGVLCSAISVYYYLRVIVFMYMKDPIESPSAKGVSFLPGLAVVLLTFLTLQIGIFPSGLKEAAETATKSVQ